MLEDCPSLGARLLRIANVAHPALPGRLETLRIATAYLGCDGVGRLAHGLIVIDAAAASPQRADAFLQRAFHTALLAAQLARIFEPALDPYELWPTALLYDVGMLRRSLAAEQAVTAYRQGHRCSELAAESALGLTPHTLLGATLCDHWDLGDELRLACLHHEDAGVGPGTLQQRDRRRMLMLADRASRYCRGDLRPDLQPALRREIVELADISDSRWFELIVGRCCELEYVVTRVLGGSRHLH